MLLFWVSMIPIFLSCTKTVLTFLFILSKNIIKLLLVPLQCDRLLTNQVQSSLIRDIQFRVVVLPRNPVIILLGSALKMKCTEKFVILVLLTSCTVQYMGLTS
jgi:hypothetical protein